MSFVLKDEWVPYCTPNQLKLLRAWAKHGTRKKAMKALGLSSENNFSQALKEVRKKVTNSGNPFSAYDAQILALQDENKRLRTELRQTFRENTDANEVRKLILGLTEETPKPPHWLTPKRLTKEHKVAGVPVAIWSDWHLGERVSAEEVNGINEFNMEIAEQRIRLLVERTKDLCFRHMTGADYPGIVVNVLGDLVSGELHPELAATDEDEILPTILFARDMLVAALSELADTFGRVYVPTAFGNHGRVFDRKPRAKRYVYRNADWLIMCLVERYFTEKGDDRVVFQIPATGESFYRVYDHRYMAVHGDDLGVRGGDGIIGAIGPIMRGEIKTRTSNAQMGRDFDTLLMGHWHQQLWLPRAIVNNTLKGFDEYARRMLRAIPTPPSQALWFTHPKHGITARWEIYLGGREGYAEAPWVSWQGE